jgi:hypothetical protein
MMNVRLQAGATPLSMLKADLKPEQLVQTLNQAKPEVWKAKLAVRTSQSLLMVPVSLF